MRPRGGECIRQRCHSAFQTIEQRKIRNMELTRLLFDLCFVTVVTFMVLAPHALQTLFVIRERENRSEAEE